jgi:hypothetical protein
VEQRLFVIRVVSVVAYCVIACAVLASDRFAVVVDDCVAVCVCV